MRKNGAVRLFTKPHPRKLESKKLKMEIQLNASDDITQNVEYFPLKEYNLFSNKNEHKTMFKIGEIFQKIENYQVNFFKLFIF